MKKVLTIAAAASILATAAIAQTTVTTTTGTGNAAVQIEPQYGPKIKSYVTEKKKRSPCRVSARASLLENSEQFVSINNLRRHTRTTRPRRTLAVRVLSLRRALLF